MKNINIIHLLGYLANKPTIKTTSSGYQIAQTTIATTDRWPDKNTGEWKERTYWHNVTMHNIKTASMLEKGDAVFVTGKVEYHDAEHENGKVRYTNINVRNNDTISRITKRRDADRNYADRNEARPIPASEIDDEIPF